MIPQTAIINYQGRKLSQRVGWGRSYVAARGGKAKTKQNTPIHNHKPKDDALWVTLIVQHHLEFLSLQPLFPPKPFD